jgi:formylglycine-generating enzyme required for sulfatase activity
VVIDSAGGSGDNPVIESPPMKTNAAVQRLVLTFGLLAASVGSVANAADAQPGDVIENSIKMKLVYIPAGEFEMSSPESG